MNQRLQAIAYLAEKIRESLSALEESTEGSQPLATELVYSSQIIQSLSQLHPAVSMAENNLSTALKTIMHIKDPLQAFSERFGIHSTHNTNVAETTSGLRPSPKDMRDLQDKISRNLTTVNTLFVLSSLSQAGRYSRQSESSFFPPSL